MIVINLKGKTNKILLKVNPVESTIFKKSVSISKITYSY